MITAHAPAPTESLSAIDAVVGAHKTLEDVVRWNLAQTPPRLVARVVVQDEYTHDVVVPWSDGVFLVYDST